MALENIDLTNEPLGQVGIEEAASKTESVAINKFPETTEQLDSFLQSMQNQNASQNEMQAIFDEFERREKIAIIQEQGIAPGTQLGIEGDNGLQLTTPPSILETEVPLTKGKRLIERGEREILETQEQQKELLEKEKDLKGLEKAGAEISRLGTGLKGVSKSVLSGIGGAIQSAFDETIRGYALGGTFLGTKIEQLRGNVTPEEAAETFNEIVNSPDFLNANDQTRSNILNIAASTVVPSIGAKKASQIPSVLGRLGAGSAVGVGSTALGTIQTEGRLPTAREAKIGGALGGLSTTILGGLAQRAERSRQLRAKNVKEVVGKITQAPKKDIKKLTKGLEEIDTKGIETFEDIAERTTDRIAELAEAQDDFYRTDPTKFKPEKAKLFSDVGGEIVESTPVKKSLEDLQEMYQKTNDPANAQRINNTINKFDNEGLSLQEANNVSREYGIEFGSKAFSKRTGDPLTSVKRTIL